MLSIPGQKNKHLGKIEDEGHTDMIEQVRRRKWTWAGQGTSAGHEITYGHCVSPPGNPTKGTELEEDRRDDGETN